ncbi:MAG TPA: hypothetical protein VGE34_01135 [Candidatus Saccharimonadales bacterium]
MRSRVLFTAADHVPSASEVFDGAIVVNNFGNIALSGAVVDPTDTSSRLELDTSVEPPILRMNNVLMSTLFGYWSEDESQFVQYDHEANQGEHIVSGDYTGPGSVLDLQ